MASLPNSKTVTYDEWLRLPEVTDAIEEVVDGQIILMPPAKSAHARIVARLIRPFMIRLDPKRYDIVSGSFGLVIRESPLTSRVPDVAVFDIETVVERDGYYRSAPQLLVEVLSPANSRREMQRKIADYASIGVPEMWIVSPEERTVEVLQLRDGSRLERSAIQTEGTLSPRLIPGVRIDIFAIWPD